MFIKKWLLGLILAFLLMLLCNSILGCLQPHSQQDTKNIQTTEKEEGQKSQGDVSSKQSIFDWSAEFKNIKQLVQNNAPSAFSQILDRGSNFATIVILIIQLRKAQTRGIGKVK